jgi:hypothetical protein
MKNPFPLIALLLLGGCSTYFAKSPAPAPVSTAPVATIDTHRMGVLDFFTGNDVPCQIRSIDGISVDTDFRLPPGNHTLTILLTHLGREYVGDVDLVIPEAKNYELKARRKGDAFTLSLVDAEAEKTVATSTASSNDRLKFLVFVVQS